MSQPLNAHRAYFTIYRKSTRKSLQWQLTCTTFTPFHSKPEKKKSKKYIYFFTQLWLDLQRVNCCEAALSAMWGLSEPRECICHPCTASHLPALHPGGLWAWSSLQPVPLLCLKRNTKAAWKTDAVPIPQPSWKGWLPWSLPCSMDQFC